MVLDLQEFEMAKKKSKKEQIKFWEDALDNHRKVLERLKTPPSNQERFPYNHQIHYTERDIEWIESKLLELKAK